MNIAVLMLLLCCSQTEKMTYAAGYIPNVQFAPFYVAQSRGYYRAEGIDLTIDYTMGPDLLKLVALGKMSVGSADPDAFIHASEQGLPLVHVATLYQTYPIALIARENILEGKRLKGKRIGISGTYGSSYLGLKAMLSQLGLKLEDIDLAPIGFTQTTALAQGRVDAVVGYANNEPLRLQQQGIPTHIYMIPTHQAMPGVGLMTSQAFLRAHPKLIEGFLRATFRGMHDIISDPEDCFALVVSKYLPELKPKDKYKSEFQVLLATLPYWKTTSSYGQTQPKAWQTLAKQMARERGGQPYTRFQKHLDRSFTWKP